MRVRLIYDDEVMADVTDISDDDTFRLYATLAEMSPSAMAQMQADHADVHQGLKRGI